MAKDQRQTMWRITGHSGNQTFGYRSYLCPDLLDYGDIGAADNLRGRVVRAFFWLMRLWRTDG